MVVVLMAGLRCLVFRTPALHPRLFVVSSTDVTTRGWNRKQNSWGNDDDDDEDDGGGDEDEDDVAITAVAFPPWVPLL
jgi:hypothetical protein